MMNLNENEKAMLFLDSFVGLDAEKKLKILSYYSCPSEMIENPEEIQNILEETAGKEFYREFKDKIKSGYVEKLIAYLDKAGVVPVTVESKNYPSDLLEINNYPLVLYCKGNCDLLNKKNLFAIVGSRNTQNVNYALAEEISGDLSESGVVVVTGTADGGDTAAINGALKTGNIICVAASGIDNIYPSVNQNLIDKVAANGLVISEYFPTVKSRQWMFPYRNRIIAGLSKGVLIVSGSFKSGTRHTANYALEYGKEVFAFPYNLGVVSGEICNYLIKNGAYLCENSQDVLSVLGVTPTLKREIALTEIEKKVYDAISPGSVHVDVIASQTGLKQFQLTPVIMSLEIKKIIVKDGLNTYSPLKILNNENDNSKDC